MADNATSAPELRRSLSLAEAIVAFGTKALVFSERDIDELIRVLEMDSATTTYQREIVKAVRDFRRRLLAFAEKHL